MNFVFQDNLMLGAILLEDISLASRIKMIVEGHLDCSALIKPGLEFKEAAEILHTLAR